MNTKPADLIRAEAQATVAPFVVQHGQYRCVSLADARRLLEPERFERMLADPIRRLGPTPTSVYPWNVVDYLCLEVEAVETVGFSAVALPQAICQAVEQLQSVDLRRYCWSSDMSPERIGRVAIAERILGGDACLTRREGRSLMGYEAVTFWVLLPINTLAGLATLGAFYLAWREFRSSHTAILEISQAFCTVRDSGSEADGGPFALLHVVVANKGVTLQNVSASMMLMAMTHGAEQFFVNGDRKRVTEGEFTRGMHAEFLLPSYHVDRTRAIEWRAVQGLPSPVAVIHVYSGLFMTQPLHLPDSVVGAFLGAIEGELQQMEAQEKQFSQSSNVK